MLALSGGLLANGLSLNSIGPKALGMGGAFVGVANDLTAIYWNPAGLSKVEGTNFMLFATDIIPIGTYKFNYPDFGIDIDAKMKTNHYISPNFFANYSTGQWSFGLGIYVPAGLGAEWDGSELLPLSNGVQQEWLSKIAVINISPAASYKVSDRFSIGLAVNIFYGMFDMKRPANLYDPIVTSFQYEEESTGIGYGVTLGTLIKLHEKVDLGLTFRTKTDVSMSGAAKNKMFGLMGAATESDFDRDVSWPLWFGAGLAFRPAENLTVAIDAQYSQWSESSTQFVTDYKDPNWKAAMEAKGENILELNWEDATQIRMGAEYLITPNLPLRLGYYRDPAPAPDETLTCLFPSSSNEVLTGGIGYKMGNLNFDFAMEYLFGTDRKIPDDFDLSLGEFVYAQPGTHHMDIFAFSIGVGYKL